MKTLFAALIIISVGIATSYAGGMLMLHVGSADGGAVAPGSCDGTIDLSSGCPQPMLGVF